MNKRRKVVPGEGNGKSPEQFDAEQAEAAQQRIHEASAAVMSDPLTFRYHVERVLNEVGK
jgi:hypothetical protein